MSAVTFMGIIGFCVGIPASALFSVWIAKGSDYRTDFAFFWMPPTFFFLGRVIGHFLKGRFPIQFTRIGPAIYGPLLGLIVITILKLVVASVENVYPETAASLGLSMSTYDIRELPSYLGAIVGLLIGVCVEYKFRSENS